MSILIESSEFGDWLLGEISQTAGMSPKLAEADQARKARLRLETLEVSKKLLLEFLTLQQAMLDAAGAARTQHICHRT
jgi:hypothetical protein